MPEPTVFNSATGQLVHAAAIADPAGGATIDAEARTATNDVLVALRAAGVIAGATDINVGHVFNGPTAQITLHPAIADPAGGATIDANCRTTINDILTVLRDHGVIAGASATTLIRAHLVLDEDTGARSSAAIADVAAGGTVDAECRTAVDAALAAMRSRNLIAQD